MTLIGWRGVAAALIFSALVSLSAHADPLQDAKCTGTTDTPWDEQIAGCGNAIDSGKISGKDLAAAFSRRGKAYQARGDLDRAFADNEQAMRLDPDSAIAVAGRGNVYFLRKDYDRAIADYVRAIALDPVYAYAFNNRG